MLFFWIPDQPLYILAEGQKYFGLRASRMTMEGAALAAAGFSRFLRKVGFPTAVYNICPLLGAQELDSDEPGLCVHQPGRTVNKECPWHALPP
jgi:hypothetical protein